MLITDQLFIRYDILYSTTLRAWCPPWKNEIYEMISIFASKLFGLHPNTEKLGEIPLSNKVIHPDVFEYIKTNNLYFYTEESRRKRLYNYAINCAATLGIVFAVSCAASCKLWKYRYN